MIIDPQTLTHQDRYKLLNGSVVPRPIAFVSSMNAEGELNLAPFSFFNVVGSSPMSVVFSVMRRGPEALKKDTLRNIEETGEYVVNIVNEALVARMNVTSADFPHGVNEFAEAGLTPIPSEVVRPPRVAESPINMECKLIQTVEVGSGPGGGTLIIGEVLRFHIWDELYEGGRIDPDKLQAVGRMAGASYTRTTDRFDLVRPVYQPVAR
ncbi:Flavin reductase like domain protein [compost metagenome]